MIEGIRYTTEVSAVALFSVFRGIAGKFVEVKDAVVYACIEQLDEKLICATALLHRNKPIISNAIRNLF